MPGAFLTLHALQWISPVEWEGPLLLAVLGSGGLVVFAIWCDRWLRVHRGTIALLLILCCGYGFGAGLQVPPNYPRFHPFVYSLENCVPLVKLGQAEFWAPDPGVLQRERAPATLTGRLLWPRAVWNSVLRGVNYLAESPTFVQLLLWIQILLGWVLATLFVAGVTGIVRKD